MDVTVTMKVVDLFFDRPAVTRRLDVANRKALSQGGAFIRRAAISRLRRRKRYSLPGESPSVHSSDPVANLRFILFGFDGRDSVIIGPVGLNQKQYINGKISGGTVPNLMEFGGRAGIREKLVGKSWMPRGRRAPRPGQPTRIRLATYAPRPFMGPAMTAEQDKFPQLWARSISA
jgi:hypothetical protein